MLKKLSYLLVIGLSIVVDASAQRGGAEWLRLDPGSAAEMRSALLFDASTPPFNVSAPPPNVPAPTFDASTPLFGASAPSTMASDHSRNVALAFGMSAVVPGAGQVYNRQWVKAAVAIAFEGALAAGFFAWRAQGRNAEDDYKAYAHEYWDAGRYASWLNDYVDFLEQEHGASIGTGSIPIPNHIDFSAPDAWSTQERQAVRDFFNIIRDVEGEVFHPETGASFSHKLPYFAEQQYYELIGKYFQFAPGWVDYPVWRENGEFTGAIDPELTGPGGTKPNVQGRFREYARDHAEANTLLRRASRVSALIVLNHVVAAIDAAITAKLHNDRLNADVELSYDIFNEPQLLGTLSWRF